MGTGGNRGRMYLYMAAWVMVGFGILSGRSTRRMPPVSPFASDLRGTVMLTGTVEASSLTRSGRRALTVIVTGAGRAGELLRSTSAASGTESVQSERTILYLSADTVAFLPGDTVTAEVSCRRVENFAPGFDYVRYMEGKGIRYTCFQRGAVSRRECRRAGFRLRIGRWRCIMTAALRQSLSPLDPENSALLTAFLTGDREFLSESTLEEFRRSGMMHALALSGLHVGIIYSILSFLFSALGGFPASRKVRSSLVVVCLWPYALLTGMGTSIFRAVVMATVYEAAVLLEREKCPSSALALSAVIVTLTDPSAPSSLSFQLSFGAMLGIVVCYRPLSSIVRRYALHSELQSVSEVRNLWALPVRKGVPGTDWVKRPSPVYMRSALAKERFGRVRRWVGTLLRRYLLKPVWDMFALSFSCQIVTVPIILGVFGTYAGWSLLANILCSPLIGTSMTMAPLCIALGDTSVAGRLCFRVLDLLLDALRFAVGVMGE